MRNIQQLKETIREILDSQNLAVLATQMRGKPYGSLIAFAATQDLKILLFATTRATRKYANLLNTPDAAMVVDTRTNQTADFADAAAVTILGNVEEVTEHDRKRLLTIYLKKHPHLREFVESPTTALLTMSVRTYILVSRFQNVQELHIQ